jgi:hypothetical protein
MTVNGFFAVKNVVHLLSRTVFSTFPLIGLLDLKTKAQRFLAKSGTVHLQTA